jgi:hypothetical protein
MKIQLPSQIFALACLGVLVNMPTLAQDRPAQETCTRLKGWKPTTQELQRTLSEHQATVEKAVTPEWPGRANLCNADLSSAQLDNANLREANLNNAVLSRAKLNNANLIGAELTNADLSFAQLNNAKLNAAKINNADLGFAKLNYADLSSAQLNKANLQFAELNHANLNKAKLNNADLLGAELKNADMADASLAGAVLAYTELSEASFAPVSPPPSPYVAGIRGLQTVKFPYGREDGLVQIRELLQKSGYRNLEREATFAIESGKTKYAIADWREEPGGAAEGVFRKVAFDFTTRYGLDPTRALLAIIVVWALLIPVYAWAILPRHSERASGIYRISPKDRIETYGGKSSVDNPARVDRLHVCGLATLGWAAYFSLISAFQIGFREFSVGTWLARAQPRNFALEATGWVRTVSGLQSLLSVYLLAMWLLTYFGRPFQ